MALKLVVVKIVVKRHFTGTRKTDFILYINENRLVPKTGLEPVHPLGQGILSPRRLPFRHFGTGENRNHYKMIGRDLQ